MTQPSSSLQRVQTVCLLVLTAVALGFALRWLAPVMVPFALAFFLAVVLSPVVELLHRRLKLPAIVGLFVALLLGVGAFGLLGTLVAESVKELERNRGEYQSGIDEIEETAIRWAAELGIELEPASAAPATDPGGGEDEGGPAVNGSPTSVAALAEDAARRLLPSLADALVGVFSQGILVLIFMMFLVTGTAHSGTLLGDVERRIKGYITTKLVVSSITGVAVFAILKLLGVPMALVFGLFAFLLNFVPSVGSIIATVLPLPLLLIGDFSPVVQVLGIALPGVVQFIVGNVIEPRMLGESMGLHPVTILLALIFWGMIWGVVGALLATPITAVLRILLEKSDLTQPVAELMAGRLPGEEPEPATG